DRAGAAGRRGARLHARPLAARFLLPEPEGPDGRLVVEVEEAGGRARRVPVLDPLPGRGGEAVAGLPREDGVPDAAVTPALDHVQHRAVRAPRPAPRASPPRRPAPAPRSPWGRAAGRPSWGSRSEGRPARRPRSSPPTAP